MGQERPTAALPSLFLVYMGNNCLNLFCLKKLMNAEKVEEFINTKMRLSHVYQPLLIRCLLDSGGHATIRQLAMEFSKEDESLLRSYEQKIKNMPLKVLKKHGIVDLRYSHKIAQ